MNTTLPFVLLPPFPLCIVSTPGSCCALSTERTDRPLSAVRPPLDAALSQVLGRQSRLASHRHPQKLHGQRGEDIALGRGEPECEAAAAGPRPIPGRALAGTALQNDPSWKPGPGRHTHTLVIEWRLSPGRCQNQGKLIPVGRWGQFLGRGSWERQQTVLKGNWVGTHTHCKASKFSTTTSRVTMPSRGAPLLTCSC